jgi:hypothetical protein
MWENDGFEKSVNVSLTGKNKNTKTKRENFTICTLAYKIINKYKVTLMHACFWGGGMAKDSVTECSLG